MRSRQQDKTGRVKVYRFRLYDVTSEEVKISNRMATPACIRRIRGEIIKRTEVDKRHLTSDGMTEVGFLERRVLSSAVAGDAVAANSDLTRPKLRCHPGPSSPWSRHQVVF